MSGRTVDDEEEAVLRRVQDDLALRTCDLEVRQDHRLRRGVVPVVTRCLLVVPDVLAGVRVQGDDRRQIEVVAAAGAAQVAAPRRPVAGADVHQVQRGVEGHGVPGCPAAAEFPVLAARVPGLRGLGHRLILEGLARVARHREPAPFLLARFGVVGRDVAAHAILRATVADHHVALEDARRAGDGVGACVVDERIRPSSARPGRRVERDQPAIEGADEDLALVERDAAVDDIAAGPVAQLARHLRVVGPQALARARIDRMDDAPRGRDIHDAVDNERRGLDAAGGFEVVGPFQAESLDVVGGDLRERAEARLGVVEAVGGPVPRRRRVRADAAAVNLGRHRADTVGRRLLSPALREGLLSRCSTEEYGEGDRDGGYDGRGTVDGLLLLTDVAVRSAGCSALPLLAQEVLELFHQLFRVELSPG